MNIFSNSSLIMVMSSFNYSCYFTYQEDPLACMCIMYYLVQPTEIGNAAALNDMFTIQNSHATSFEHNDLFYCACGKLHITIFNPRDFTGPTQAYIINHFNLWNRKYWTLYFTGNYSVHCRASLTVGSFY